MDTIFLNSLQQHRTEKIGLATIVAHYGSTPRSVGARMALLHDGRLIGTIGGGKLEAEIIRELGEVMQSGKATIVRKDFSGADAASMDMICGGSVRVLLEVVSPERKDFWRLVDGLQESRVRVLAMVIAAGQTEYYADDAIYERLPELSNDVRVEEVTAPRIIAIAGNECFLEPVNRRVTVHIFGAGHVSQALANLMAPIDFRTVVYDDREDFASRERFPHAEAVRVISPLEAGLEGVEITADDFIVIVTRGHLQDKNVLERSLGTRAGYIGMIGSRRKNRMIFDELLKRGFTQERLDRVHAPIGLDILAETPEEIAMSIAAELIRERARNRRGQP